MVDSGTLRGIEDPIFRVNVLKSLRQFDRQEVQGTLSGIFGPTMREQCFYTLYLRAQRNVDTLLTLTDIAHFQAIATLGRCLFELCLEIELLAKTHDGDLRMRVFKSLELLRAARALVSYEDGRSDQKIASERRTYINESGPVIEEQARKLWPNIKLNKLKHWTNLNIYQQAKSLGDELEAIYVHSYRQFSWYVHGGVQGTLDVTPDHFSQICGRGFGLSVIAYSRILPTIARAMQLTTHDQDFERKLEFALNLPRTESLKEARELRREIGL